MPSNADGRERRRRGGLGAWKRYVAIAAVVALVLVAGYTFTGTKEEEYAPGVYNPKEPEYTKPELERPPSPADEIDEDVAEQQERPAKGGSGDKAESGGGSALEETTPDVDDDKSVHILPLPDDGSAVQDDTSEFTAVDVEDPEDEEAPVTEAQKGDHPTSFETDPNAAATTYCTKSFSETKPIVQYALTIDAGSTGSRIHVYKFHNCEASPQLEYETFKMLNPGLSAFPDDPSAAAASLDPLLVEAKRVVPESLWKCTPVEVKATAGLRLLGEAKSEAILDEVRNHLESKYPFSLGGKDAVEVMDGKNEGVYAWITANYLLGKIGEGAAEDDTMAVMDLGGGSTQIVFEPKFPSGDDKLAEGDHKFSLSFGGKNFTLYQHSYLGYGLMSARRSVHNLVQFMWSWSNPDREWDSLTEETEIANACLSRGTTRQITLNPPFKTPVKVTMNGSTGSYEACKRVVELVMEKHAMCKVEPCSFKGVYQPALIDTFPNGKFLALSYFTDRIKPLLSAKKSGSLTLSDLKSIATDVCDGETAWRKRWADKTKYPDALTELQDRPEYCLDLTFMVGLLGLGYEIKDDRELVVEKKLKGTELGWALGAGLALVEKAELTCTA